MLFIRNFNRFINSKTGIALEGYSYRGGYLLWEKFENLLKEVIFELGLEYYEQLENPLLPSTANTSDIQIYAHKTKRDVPTGDFFYMQMHLKELFTFDTEGWGADHSMNRVKPSLEKIDIGQAEHHRLSLLKDFLEVGTSKHPQPELGSYLPTEDFDLDCDYILVPLQIPRDYVIKYHSTISVINFIDLVVAWAVNRNQTVCFKIHPYSTKDFEIKYAVNNYVEGNSVVKVSNRNIHELIASSTGVFVINSGVGFEGLIHGKPVVTFGDCDYKFATFSASESTLDLAKEYICNYSREQKETASRFLYNYYVNRAFSIKDEFIKDSKIRLFDYLDRRLKQSNSHLYKRSYSLHSGSDSSEEDFGNDLDLSQDDASHQQNDVPDDRFDLVYVLHRKMQSWILGAICREIDKYYPGKSFFYTSSKVEPPLAGAYFFTHYLLWQKYLIEYPWLRLRHTIVFFTHPHSLRTLEPKTIECLNQASKVICMCSKFSDFLVSQGVFKSSIEVCIPGADPLLFKPHVRGNGLVGFCSSFYARKSPDLVLNIVKQMQHRRFLLLGKNWEEYERYDELASLDNLSYIEVPYSDYPSYYDEMDVFVSPSRLEGGPIPLIESMMCNAVPVASDTGFSRDIITQGKNGFIFDVDESADAICGLIDRAYTFEGNVRDSVKHLSWERFSHEIQSLAVPKDHEYFSKLERLYRSYDLMSERLEAVELSQKTLRSKLTSIEAENHQFQDKERSAQSHPNNLWLRAIQLFIDKLRKHISHYLG